MRYRSEVDGLRALAVVPVILFHAGFDVMSGGFVGVDIFFVISGYLITTIIATELDRGDFSLARFYERRARRILPGLFFVLACCIPLAWMLMLPNEFKTFCNTLVSVVFFASNIRLWYTSGYFDATSEVNPLLHTWSLAVEEQYYMVFPLVLLLCWRIGSGRVVLGVSAVFLLSFMLSEWGWRHWPYANFYLAPMRAWEILAGSLCAFALRGGRPSAVRWEGAAALLGLILIGLAIFTFDRSTPTPSYFSLVPVAGTCLILLFARDETWVARLLSLRLLVGIGLVSYSAYLWHQPIFAFARMRTIFAPAPSTMLALCVLVFALAYVTWRFIETPWRNRKFQTGYASPATLGIAIAAAGGLIVFGSIGHYQNGWPQRISAAAYLAASGASDSGAYHGSCLIKAIEAVGVPDERCRLGKKSDQVDFILFGDSFAVSLAEGLNQAALKAGKSGFIVATNSCLPIKGIGGVYAPTLSVCDVLQRDMETIAEKFGAKTVILHGAWHELDSKYTLKSRYVDAENGATAYSAPLLQSLQAFIARGAKVYIVCCTPDVSVHVPHALTKIRMYSDDTDIRPTSQQISFANRTALRLFHSKAISDLANLIDVTPYFCDGQRCRLEVAGRPLLFDKGHLSKFGSLQLTHLLEAIFQ